MLTSLNLQCQAVLHPLLLIQQQTTLLKSFTFSNLSNTGVAFEDSHACIPHRMQILGHFLIFLWEVNVIRLFDLPVQHAFVCILVPLRTPQGNMKTEVKSAIVQYLLHSCIYVKKALTVLMQSSAPFPCPPLQSHMQYPSPRSASCRQVSLASSVSSYSSSTESCHLCSLSLRF